MTNSTTFPGSVTCPTSTVSNAMTLGTTKTFVVTVSDASGYNKYYIDGYLQASLELHQQQTYIFDLSSSTLSGHPFEFSTTNDGSHGGGSAYTTGITTTGTYASSEKRTFFVPVGAPTTLYYYCTAHSGMGAGVSISPTAELVVSGHIESTDLVVTGTGGVGIGVGTTAQRPSNPTTGMIRYNSTIGFMESYLEAGWAPIAQPPAVTGVSPTTTLTSGGYAAGWYHQTNLFHPYPNNNDNFGGHNTNAQTLGTEGVSISSDGQYAIVAVRNDDEGSSDAGSAQIFKRTGSTWAWQAELRALGANEAGFSGVTSQGNWYFGWNVNISGDGVYAFVTQYQGQSGPSRSGTVHVFKRTDTTWTWKTELFNQNPEANDNFGYNVDSNSDGSYLIVGAYKADPGSVASDAGSAQIFKRTNESWAHQAQLLHPTPAANDFFGWSVSISGDGTIAVVGVYQDDIGSDVNGNHGSAQVYLRNTSTDAWTWEDELLHPPSSGVSNGPGTYDNFGGSVAITSDGTRIIVGAPYAWDEAPGGSDVGAAFIFRRDNTTWVHEKELHAYDSELGMRFGWRVSISGDGTYAAVSAHKDGDNANAGDVTRGGVLHLFKRTNTTWALEKELVNPNRVEYDYMGDGGVAISSDATHIITGSPYSVHGASQGSAQIFYLRTLLLDSATQVFTATGSGIIPGSTVQLEGADGTLYSVFDTTTPNAAGTQVTFKMGALGATGAYTVANQPYKIRVNSTSGLSGTSTTPLIGLPVGWTTAAGADLTFTTESTTTQTLVGTDGAGGTNRKFEVAPSSASLPAGLTLTEAGAITGTITESAATGTTSVTFRLTDIGSDVFTDRAINIVWNSDAYTFSPNPFTFTNAGLYGRDGPDLAATKTAYGATGWWQTSTSFNQVSGKQGFQLWTVPSTGTYTIEAKGAQGGYRYTGSTYNSNNTAVAPGNGATVKATFALTKGATVVLIVAQSPARGQHWASGTGGGGASWVLKPGAFTSNNDVYLVAGGGGGSGAANYVTSTNQGGHATGDGQGTLGSGGASGDRSAGGGAGWTVDGSGSYQTTYYYGLKPSNGALGGNPYHATHYSAYQSPGGFGGGGSNGGECSGGGAGASGGRAATSYLSGNTIGGTSYIMPNGTGGVTVTARTFSGNHTDIHGSIIITQN